MEISFQKKGYLYLFERLARVSLEVETGAQFPGKIFNNHCGGTVRPVA